VKGHDQLIAMRRAGAAPSIVFVETDDAMWANTRDWHADAPDRAQLRVEASDRPARLDLRCLVGLTVWVNGSDSRRVFDVAAACEQHKAGRVIASVAGTNDRGELDVLEIADSQGDIAWPSC
jgi:hypothetical protein